MDESSQTQNRRTRRSKVLMTATLELSGSALSVKLRNLSAEGALIEGDDLPVEGSKVVFKRLELSVAGRIAWVMEGRAGVTFNVKLEPEAMLHHIPTPKPRVKPDFRRPGLSARRLSPGERKMGEDWVWTPSDRLGD
ncbi:MAG TPA: PilZ domain-containing protein [Sphingomicrobium sp.]|nr:PilZ domain-containing protein [Sphingomicrobium sp.]